MATLTDAELLRIVDLKAGSAEYVLPALRAAIVLLPTTSLHDSSDDTWPLFVTAIIDAMRLSDLLTDNDGWLVSGRPLAVVTQIVGILGNRHQRSEEVQFAFNRASIRHWIDVEHDSWDLPKKYRPTLLGEKLVHQALTGAINRVGITDETPNASAIARLKKFRSAFLTYVSDAREKHYQNESTNATMFFALQDAWIELADVVYPPELYDVADIESAATVMIPDNSWDVWNRAENQIGELILSVGREERLQRARAEAFRKDIDKLFPAPKAPVVAEPPKVTEAEPPVATAVSPIEYIGRDAAAALCGVTKTTLEKWMAEDLDAPDPIRPGGGGKRHEYDYQTMRPWLERRSGRKLPEHYQANGR